MTLSEEQKKIRYGKIPCSLIGAILGVDKYKSPYKAYLEIVGEEGENTTQQQNTYTEWGHRLEPVVAKKFAEKNNVTVQKNTVTFTHPNGWLCGTPDFFYAYNGADRGLEIKTASAYLMGEYGDEHTDEIPTKHYLQCLGYMIITETDVWDLCVLIGGSTYKEYRVTATPEQKQVLLQRLKQFYDTHIQPHVPPALTTLDDVTTKYPTSTPELTKPATQEMLSTIQEMHKILSQIATLEKSYDALDVRLRNDIADAELIVDPCNGEKLLTYKNIQPRKTLDVQRLRKDYPRIYDEYLAKKDSTQPPPRVLRFAKLPHKKTSEG